MGNVIGSVKLEFKTLEEAYRVRRIIEMWNPSNDDLVPWRDELVSRLGIQLDVIEGFAQAIKKRKTNGKSKRSDKLLSMLYHTDLLIASLKKHLSSCEYFKKFVLSGDTNFVCNGCGDTKVCEVLRELIKDGKEITEQQKKKAK